MTYYLHNNDSVRKGADCPGNGLYCQPKPVVVIDFSDTAAVKGFRDLYEKNLRDYGHQGVSNDLDPLLDTLHEFANPKPDEPLGKYAEVEDERGWLYFRDPNGDWRLASNPTSPRQWSTVPAVRVLSEGVPS